MQMGRHKLAIMVTKGIDSELSSVALPLPTAV